MKSPNFIVLFLLRWHVSLCRSSPATGHDSRFHFPHSPVIPFDPSLYYIFVLKTKTLRYFTVFPLLLSSPAFLFLPLVHVYMVLPYKSPPVVVIIFLRQGAFRQCPFFLVLCNSRLHTRAFRTLFMKFLRFSLLENPAYF